VTDQQQPHIVKDFVVSGTRIKIADDYCCDKTREDVAQILRKIARTAQAHLAAAAMSDEQGSASIDIKGVSVLR